MAFSYELDNIFALRDQEETAYLHSRYFPQPRKQRDEVVSGVGHLLNTNWRKTISEHQYKFVDTYDMPREIVSISVNYFDRTCATHANRVTDRDVQYIACTSLYLAIKIHAAKKLLISDLVKTTRKMFGPLEFIAMEKHILSSLRWKMNPPTPRAFIEYFFTLFPASNIRPFCRNNLFEISQYYAELSVCDSFFVRCKPSHVALASVLIAIEKECCIPLKGTLHAFLGKIAQDTNLDYAWSDIIGLVKRLDELYSIAEGEIENYVASTFSLKESDFSSKKNPSPTSIIDYIS